MCWTTKRGFVPWNCNETFNLKWCRSLGLQTSSRYFSDSLCVFHSQSPSLVTNAVYTKNITLSENERVLCFIHLNKSNKLSNSLKVINALEKKREEKYLQKLYDFKRTHFRTSLLSIPMFIHCHLIDSLQQCLASNHVVKLIAKVSCYNYTRLLTIKDVIWAKNT